MDQTVRQPPLVNPDQEILITTEEEMKEFGVEFTTTRDQQNLNEDRLRFRLIRCGKWVKQTRISAESNKWVNYPLPDTEEHPTLANSKEFNEHKEWAKSIYEQRQRDERAKKAAEKRKKYSKRRSKKTRTAEQNKVYQRKRRRRVTIMNQLPGISPEQVDDMVELAERYPDMYRDDYKMFIYKAALFVGYHSHCVVCNGERRDTFNPFKSVVS